MIDRQKLWLKYEGRCAYCGEKITIENMQKDHIIPKVHFYKYPGKDLDKEDNLNPSCRKCNNFKFRYTIEELRYELEMQVERLKKIPQFDRALRFGLIHITNKSVKFYFEWV
jgi:5-methylcytosine-specific restriction endonuclease McrA